MKYLLLFILLGLQFSACSTEASKTDKDPVLEAYLDIKNALVKTNAKKAQKAAEKMATMELLPASLKTSLGEIAKSEDIEVQRKAFHSLSKAYYEVLKGQKASSKLYLQYCPMAFKNTGASWISSREEIYNPYFGDKMLQCGSVKEVLE